MNWELETLIVQEKIFVWQDWEDLHLRFWAFRLHLYHVIGHQQIGMDEFLCGAYCGADIKENTMEIPSDLDNIKVIHIHQRAIS